MLPSRGLSKAQALLPGRRAPRTIRHFSHSPLPQTRTSPSCISQSPLLERPQWQQIYRNSRGRDRRSQPFQSRFISTSTAETGPYNTPLPPADTFSPTSNINEFTSSSYDTLTHATVGSAGATQWYAGYLKDIGIDFGWGPSSTIQFLFEHLHMIDGLSIGGSILVTATIIRILTFPLIVSASHNGAKLSALREITEPIQKKISEASKTENQIAIQEARLELRKVYQSSGINVWKSFMPMLQLPIGFGFWRLTRNMADVPVPGMESAGFLWFKDLIFPDPFFVLPIATGLLQHMTIRLGGEEGMTASSTKLRQVMMYGLPALSVIFIGFAPAAVQISFCAAAGLSLVTTSLLRQPAVRAYLKLAPRVKHAPKPVGPESPYKGTINIAGRARTGTYQPPSSAKSTSTSTKTSASASAAGGKRRFSMIGSIANVWNSGVDFVGDIMPEAKARAEARTKKYGNRKADDYETKRQAELEKDRWRWEDAMKEKESRRRRR